MNYIANPLQAIPDGLLFGISCETLNAGLERIRTRNHSVQLPEIPHLQKGIGHRAEMHNIQLRCYQDCETELQEKCESPNAKLNGSCTATISICC